MHREFDSDRASTAWFDQRVLVAATIVALVVLAWCLADVFMLVFGGIFQMALSRGVQ